MDAAQIKLRELVDTEDKAKPLSDMALVEQLKNAGFEVARRHVTKSRKLLGIPSSRQGRDWTKKPD